MNCNQIQDILLELFAEKSLPDEIRNHLSDCPKCQKFHEELNTFSQNLPTDESFYPDCDLAQRISNNINEGIDQLELSRENLNNPMWKQFVPVAAAIFLILGIAAVSNFIGIFRSDSNQTANDNPVDSSLALIDSDDIDDFSQISIDDVLTNISSDDGLISGDYISDDLTDEEFKYLKENLNIGEIL